MNIREPQWTAEEMNRKCGDTTFKTCGWCKHRGCGIFRHNCMLSGNCSLFKEYSNDVEFDTQCKIAFLGKDDLMNLIEYKQYKIEEYRNCINSTKKEKEVINKLWKRAKKTPPLPDSRVFDYYNLDDIVYVYFEDKGQKWYRGKVVSGYRHHDGCVSYVIDELPKSNGGWGCGYAVPIILKEWEYKYFLKNKENFKIWLNLSKKEYNGNKLNMERVFEALYEN